MNVSVVVFTQTGSPPSFVTTEPSSRTTSPESSSTIGPGPPPSFSGLVGFVAVEDEEEQADRPAVTATAAARRKSQARIPSALSSTAACQDEQHEVAERVRPLLVRHDAREAAGDVEGHAGEERRDEVRRRLEFDGVEVEKEVRID